MRRLHRGRRAWLFRALRPRLTNREPSRFAFPHLAGADLSTLTEADPAAVRTEGWVQAPTLGEIFEGKYTCLTSGLTAGLVAVGAFVVWLLLVPG